MTIRLYDKDVDMLDFSAVVKTCVQRENGYVVTLDQTAFFPEGGGQGADHGTLGGAQVLDAHDVHGEVEHLVSAPLAIGSEVRGHVDAARRLDMMQQHSGEHMFSGLVHGLFGYDNVGFHIGTEAVTMDFNGPLTEEDVKKCIKAAVADKERGMGNYDTEIDEGAYDHIARIANGDVRTALNAIELAILTTEADGNGVIHVTEDIAAESIQQKLINCDDQQFYDMLSAFCKSLRGGDSDAAIAWFARLIYAGIDPRIICRRLIAHASEDVGLANPQAMVQAVAAAQALEFVGMPEAGLSITQAIIFICESPKSNSVVIAKDTAFAEAKSIPDQPVPIHLRDTSYPGASKLGHGRGYKYPHDYPGHVVAQEYMPPSVKGHKYYIPGELGSEGKIRQNHINQGRIKEK